MTSEVIMVTCPFGTIMSGGGTTCNSNNFNSSTTNFGVIESDHPLENSFIGNCVSNGLFHSDFKFGPPVTVRAVCLSSTNATALQATNAGVATLQSTSVAIEDSSQPQQGEPSEEALLLLESLREAAAERDGLFNER